MKNLGNFWPPDSSTRWFGTVTFAFNYRIGAFDTISYHLLNILIHSINAILVYGFVTITLATPWFQQAGGKQGASAEVLSGRFFIPFFTALFFASHPIQTQAITYIVQRYASLATMFYVCAVIFYAKSRLALQKKQTLLMTAWYLGSLLSAVFAMKTKEIAFTLPVVITLYEFAFFRAPLRRRMLVLLPLLLTLLIIPVSLVGMDTHVEEVVKTADSATRLEATLSRTDYLITQLRVVATYLRLLLLPIHQNLDYDYPVFHSLWSLDVFPALLLHIALIGAGGALYSQTRRRIHQTNLAGFDRETPLFRLIAFGIFWFYITLSVESTLIPIRDVIFEHRLYLPSAGFFIAMASALELLKRRLALRYAGAAKIIVIVVLLAALTAAAAAYMRNAVWADSVRLWSDTVGKSPQKARPHVNLGQTYYDSGRIDDAIVEYQAALLIDPHFQEAHYDLGNSYLAKGSREPAMREYEWVVSRDAGNPQYSFAHYQLGKYYFEQRRYAEAKFHFGTLLMINPYSADAHNELGSVYAQQGNVAAARLEFEKALRLAPGFTPARSNLRNIAK